MADGNAGLGSFDDLSKRLGFDLEVLQQQSDKYEFGEIGTEAWLNKNPEYLHAALVYMHSDDPAEYRQVFTAAGMTPILMT